MEKKFLTTVLIAFLLSPILLYAQNSSGNTKKEKTVEELFLQSVQMTVIGEQAVSPERESKLKALDFIDEMISNGKASSNSSDIHSILDYLSLTGTGVTYRENGLLINNFPEVRRRACEELGKLGGESSKDSLINILLTDKEPMVLSEAAFALGKIGLNKNNQVSQALSYAILNQDIMLPDNNFAFAVLLAFDKLIKSNHGLRDPTVLRAIIRIQNGNYIKKVKAKAQEVLETLQNS